MHEEVLATTSSSEHTLVDGTHILVRPVVPGDRAEIAAGYQTLSPRSRHTRFFAPPDDLSESDLDYLTDLDYYDRYALAAFALDEPGRPGVAVARYVRERDDLSSAEVAVTVLDAYQHRGIGTLLMQLLADVAVTNDVRTFSFYVMWENDDLIELLRQQGALVTADEPGVARVELALPEPGADLADGALRPVVRARFTPDG